MAEAEIGVIGLGVMGANLALNIRLTAIVFCLHNDAFAD